MERIFQFAFYELGKKVQAITSVTGDARPTDLFLPLIRLQTRFRLLLNGDPIQLGVSRVRGQAVYDAVENFIKQHCYGEDGTTFSNEKAAQPVAAWRWSSLIRTIESFETVFQEELREAATYHVPQRGIFDPAKLIDNADSTFPKPIQQHIPQKARDEWKAAGRCLAFNLLSASGFHVARSVEAVLEAYFAAFGGTGSDRMNWGHYVAELEKLSSASPAPDDRTVAEIRQMKDDWRNPLMHPRVDLNESQARMLFANGESLIIAMATEMQQIAEQGGVQSGFDNLDDDVPF